MLMLVPVEDTPAERVILTITLRSATIRESDEVGPDVIADFAEDGTIVRFEILGASHLVDDPRRVALDITTPALAIR